MENLVIQIKIVGHHQIKRKEIEIFVAYIVVKTIKQVIVETDIVVIARNLDIQITVGRKIMKNLFKEIK